ncbi:chromate efflux transporter [Leptospira sp. 'Mane']|uniref:chromate efflux transporter n=1 Tax=Leptospira sp. 'Mane' TaxID=3387407 RepID=UPI00398A73CD
MEKISTKEQWKVWTHVAAHSFGGPAGQIAVIHKLVVEEKKIISEERFLHALNFCMLLPGPEAQQLATYMGWLMNKWRGGLIAGVLFIVPGFLSILLLSYLYIIFNDAPLIQGLFYGIKPAMIAIVTSALYKISKKSLKNNFYRILASLTFIASFFFNVSFPIIIILSATIGMLYGKLHALHKQIPDADSNTKPPLVQTLKIAMLWILVWTSPIIFTLIVFGENSTFHSLNIFFSKMSMVTFGGAYAALSYVAQNAVEVFGWLQGTEMLDGLAMAETTPGPLIQTVQFVGFMGAYRFPGFMNPYLAAFIGSVLTTWMTFAPCFLWIFTFAPYVEYIRGQKIFSDALSAISASVVGVIFNLSLWFVLKTLFLKSEKISYLLLDFDYPIFSTIDYYATIICLIAIFMQFKLNKGLFTILGVCITLGISTKYL